ncbi:MAG: hypothetical protein P8Y71_19685, partial [Pseudolabrys sp.]
MRNVRGVTSGPHTRAIKDCRNLVACGVIVLVEGDDNHTIEAPNLADALAAAHKRFVGYIETGSPRKHNPWES